MSVFPQLEKWFFTTLTFEVFSDGFKLNKKMPEQNRGLVEEYSLVHSLYTSIGLVGMALVRPHMPLLIL